MYLFFQQIQAQTVVIIHPGSQNLRMGRASDLNPVTVLNAIARRRKQGGIKHEDSFLPNLVPRVSSKISINEARIYKTKIVLGGIKNRHQFSDFYSYSFWPQSSKM